MATPKQRGSKQGTKEGSKNTGNLLCINKITAGHENFREVFVPEGTTWLDSAHWAGGYTRSHPVACSVKI